MSGNSLNGKDYVFLTLVQDDTTKWTPNSTLVFDSSLNYWGFWDSGLFDVTTAFDVIGWTDRTTAAVRQGAGILTNGDVIEYYNKVDPVDFNSNNLYIDDDYIADDYFETVGAGDSSSIDMCVILQ